MLLPQGSKPSCVIRYSIKSIAVYGREALEETSAYIGYMKPENGSIGVPVSAATYSPTVRFSV